MNDGVALLLDRMKTNPDEFAMSEGLIGKWDSLIREYETVLDPDDVKAFKEARNILLQQQFTERVMEELVEPKKLDSWSERIMQQKGITSATTTQGLSSYNVTSTINANSLTLGSTTINEETLKHIQAHKTYLDAQKPKEHKTLFGRLFNYS